MVAPHIGRWSQHTQVMGIKDSHGESGATMFITDLLRKLNAACGRSDNPVFNHGAESQNYGFTQAIDKSLVMFSPGGTVLPHIKSGTLRGLALSGRQRLAALPDVPTFAEAGVKGLDSTLWFGLNAPAGTPASVIAYLNKEVGAVLNLPDVKASLSTQMIFPAPGPSEAFGRFIREDTERWERVVKAAGIKAAN